MTERNWNTGDAMTAGDVTTYLQRQVVISTTSGAKGPTWLGKRIYLTDYDVEQWWDGAKWNTVPNGVIDTHSGTGTGVGGFIVGTVVTVNGSPSTFTNVPGEVYRYMWDFNLVARAPTTIPTDDVYTVHPRANATNVDFQRDHHISYTNILNEVSGWVDISWSTAASRTLDLSILRGIGSDPGEIPIGGNFATTHMGNL